MSSGLVNLSSKRGKAVVANKMLELYNLEYSRDIKNSIGVDYIATVYKVGLNRRSTRILRDVFESGIGYKGTSYYTYKNTSNNMFNRANKLVINRLAKL